MRIAIIVNVRDNHQVEHIKNLINNVVGTKVTEVFKGVTK